MENGLPVSEIVKPVIARKYAGKAAIVIVSHEGDFPPKTLLKRVEKELAENGLNVMRVGLLDNDIAPNPVERLIRLAGRNIDIFSIVCGPDISDGKLGKAVNALNIHRNTYAEENICSIFWVPAGGMRCFNKHASNFLDFRTRFIEVGFSGTVIPLTSREFGDQIDNAGSPQEIVSILKSLRRLSEQSVIEKRDEYYLFEKVFLALRQITEDQPFIVEDLIHEHLLPMCVRAVDLASDATPSGEHNIFRENLCNCLVTWIKQYPPVFSLEIRDSVLNRLLEYLDSENIQGALYALSHIGFRQRDLVVKLWDIAARHDNEIGDRALSTLISLGIERKEKEKSIAETHSRMFNRYNRSLVFAIRRLADPRSIPRIVDNWLYEDFLEKSGFGFETCLQLISEIADENHEDRLLQDKAWNIIYSASEKKCGPDHPLSLAISFSRIFKICDSPNVIWGLLDFLQHDLKSSNYKKNAASFVAMTRLDECIRPRQLSAYAKYSNNGLIGLLKTIVFEDTKDNGRHTTKEMNHKLKAWENLFRLGRTEPLDWFDQAVSGETNPYVREKMCREMACFRIDTLPEKLISRVMEPCDSKRENPEKWVFRYGAIDIALSSASMAAFEALLNAGLNTDGEALVKVEKALAEVSLVLVKNKEKHILNALLKKIGEENYNHQRSAAAGALEFLAMQNVLPPHIAADLEKYLIKNDLSDVCRVFIASALGYMTQSGFSPKTLNAIIELANRKNDWISSHALSVLARHDHLAGLENLIENKIGLVRKGDAWDLPKGPGTFDWTAYFTVWMHHFHRKKFEPAIKTILSAHPWYSVEQVLSYWADRSHVEEDIAEIVKEIVIDRAVKEQKENSAEKEVFSFLSILLPDALASHPWEKHWRNWLPESRVSLAESLKDARYKMVDSRVKAIGLLTLLLGDENYAVRRSAYRSFCQISPEALNSWAVKASESEAPVELRVCAAEAWEWLDDLNKEKIHCALLEDPEPDVRKAARFAEKNRRMRLWAESYLKRILSIENFSNEKILEAWPYAKSLERMGDDSVIQKLANRLNDPDLPLHAKHWISEIKGKLEENWKKRTSNWPQPWYGFEGKAVYGQGKIIGPDNIGIPVAYGLWHKAASAPFKYNVLNGIAYSEEKYRFLTFPENSILTLVMEDGRSGEILIRTINQNAVTFINRENFPYL